MISLTLGSPIHFVAAAAAVVVVVFEIVFNIYRYQLYIGCVCERVFCLIFGMFVWNLIGFCVRNVDFGLGQYQNQLYHHVKHRTRTGTHANVHSDIYTYTGNPFKWAYFVLLYSKCTLFLSLTFTHTLSVLGKRFVCTCFPYFEPHMPY